MWRALTLTACIVAAVLSQPIGDSDAQVYNNGVAVQTDEEQIANKGAIRQKRDSQDVQGSAKQTDELQEAWADGNYAKQGNDGQYVEASDFGGPIVQILQRVFRGGDCCSCGCDCGCEDITTPPGSTST